MKASACLIWIWVIELLCTTLSQPVDPQIEMVLVVHRHGSRTQLYKDHLLRSEGGATLTPRGEEQLVQVGRDFQKRYLTPGCDIGLCLQGLLSDGKYHHSEVHAASSGYDRTISSAQCFLQGLFNRSLEVQEHWSPIPVYSSSTADDHVLRAYDKCPRIQERLEAFYSSSAFETKESESLALRTMIAGRLHENVTALSSFWGVYDRIVSADEKGNAAAGGSDNIVNWTTAELDAVGNLAGWLEGSKFGDEISDHLCGGSLLGDIRNRIQNGVTTGAPRLVLYSAHYPTLLCLLSALGIRSMTSSPVEGLVPAYGASLAFEVHRDEHHKRWVRLVFRNGPSAEPQMVLMPCALSGQPEDDALAWCSVDAFALQTADRIFNNTHDWCRACANSEMTACSCLHLSRPEKEVLETHVKTEAPNEIDDSTADTHGDDGDLNSILDSKSSAVVGAIVGAVMGAAGLFAGQILWKGRRATVAARASIIDDPPQMTTGEDCTVGLAMRDELKNMSYEKETAAVGHLTVEDGIS